MKGILVVPLLICLPALTLMGACDGGFHPCGLPGDNVNLIFVVSPDAAYQTPGDVDPTTANLTGQGLQRSLMMGSYLKEHLLEGRDVTAVYALEPMTHLQTAQNYPDMAGIAFVQQFALLNQITLNGTTGNSYPIGTSYGPGSVPSGVVEPTIFPPDCRGLDFNDAAGNNIALATRIIDAHVPGYYVFAAPWETTSALLASINDAKGYGLDLPPTFAGSNHVHVISIAPSGAVSLSTLDSKLNPSAGYPVLPSGVPNAPCGTQQAPFEYARTGGVDGAVVPAGMNTNETVYLIRHAEAHPTEEFEDGNYVGAGQWRALAMPYFLHGKISPDQIYAIDPAQAFGVDQVGFSYVRPSLTVLPYAVADNLPYHLVASFYIGAATDLTVADKTVDFFFKGGAFSDQTVLLAWEHEHFPPLITTLLQSYGGSQLVPSLTWPQSDYDTIWTVKLDGSGNVTVDNLLCEGIDSAGLPAEAPRF